METVTGTAAAVSFDPHDGDVSETVVTAVAAATGIDPLELEPLYYVVDPDALNSLFDSSRTYSSTPKEFRFTMAGCEVVVRDQGEVTVIPPTENDETTTVDPVEK